MSRSLDLLTDVCSPLPHVAKRMFGGYGFFAPNGGMFAGIVTDDEVILKLVEGPDRDELISLGGHPWQYTGQSRPMTMSEWIVVPEDFYDDLEAFAEWAKRAHRAAPAKKLKKAKARPMQAAAGKKPAATAKAARPKRATVGKPSVKKPSVKRR